MAENEVDRPLNAPRFAVLISGTGSNLRAIYEHMRAQNTNADFAVVISNEPDAPGLQWAKSQGLETRVVSHREFSDRACFDEALAKEIDAFSPDYVILAGFMRILTPAFVEHYAGRMVNIHPSLLPSFAGMRTHQRALDARVGWHGCTIHFVTPEVDGGPIIAQAALEVHPEDNAERLAQRVQRLEHILYPRVVQWLAEGRIVQNETGAVDLIGIEDRHLRIAQDS